MKKYGPAAKLACFFLFLFLFLALSACSALPRIIILHDALTPEEHMNLGVAYERKGEYGPAMKQYREASKKLPAAWVYMGNVCYETGDMGRAEKYYKKAIDKNKKDPDAYNNLAWLYYTERQKLDKAETLAGKAVRLSTSDPDKEATYEDTLNKIKALKAEDGKKIKTLKGEPDAGAKKNLL